MTKYLAALLNMLALMVVGAVVVLLMNSKAGPRSVGTGGAPATSSDAAASAPARDPRPTRQRTSTSSTLWMTPLEQEMSAWMILACSGFMPSEKRPGVGLRVTCPP